MRRAGLPILVCWSILLLGGSSWATVEQTVQVQMRDGVSLATEVWRPDGAVVQRPVLLRRTPYGRALDASTIDGLLGQGYTVVSQDVRGRGDSAGVFLPFLYDASDGYDTIQWVAAQPFSNGRVGTWSASAEGIVQLLAAGEGPPALRCAHVGVATGDLYEGIMPGGAWRQDLTTNWLLNLNEPAALSLLRGKEVLDDFWAPGRLDSAKRAKVKAPILMYGGFFDIFSKDTLKTQRLLQQEADPSVRGSQYLVFGPWTHGGTAQALQGEVTFPADAPYNDFVADLVAYFAWCLKDGPAPSFPPVRYYRLKLADDGKTATGAWIAAQSWPPASTSTTYFLTAEGLLTTRPPSSLGAAAKLHADPAAPIPSHGGGNLSTPAGPFDQADLDARADVAIATTLPATSVVTVEGDVTARIHASSSTTDADVVVRLSQVTPSGRVMLLAEGVRRGRFVAGYDAIRPLTPGAPAIFDVEVGPVSLVLPQGHALRVSVQPSSSPRYEANPGVAEALSSNPALQQHDLTVLRDSLHPSAVTLPIAAGAIPEPAGPDAGLADAAAPGPDAAYAGTDAQALPGPDAHSQYEDATIAAGSDAGAASADATVSAPGSSGCSCSIAPNASGLLVLALLPLVRRRRAGTSPRLYPSLMARLFRPRPSSRTPITTGPPDAPVVPHPVFEGQPSSAMPLQSWSFPSHGSGAPGWMVGSVSLQSSPPQARER
jgi:MYXO-CTERM domain-containing protein